VRPRHHHPRLPPGLPGGALQPRRHEEEGVEGGSGSRLGLAPSRRSSGAFGWRPRPRHNFHAATSALVWIDPALVARRSLPTAR